MPLTLVIPKQSQDVYLILKIGFYNIRRKDKIFKVLNKYTLGYRMQRLCRKILMYIFKKVNFAQ